MTDDDLKTWAALAEKATPGPWSAQWLYGALRHINRNMERDAFVEGLPDDAQWPEKEDAAFIAAMSTAVPALIAEVRRLKGAHETLRKAADAFVYVGDISGPGAQSVYNEALSTLLPLLRPTP